MERIMQPHEERRNFLLSFKVDNTENATIKTILDLLLLIGPDSCDKIGKYIQ